MEKLSLIENTIINTYKKNMNFLKENHEQLFKRVSLLSEELENETSKEKYSLEFEDGIFNILDLSNEEYLYESDPYYDAQYKESKYYPNIQEAISLVQTQKIEKIRNPKYKVDSFEYINEYIELIEKQNFLKNTKFSSVGKHIFVGTLLGIHIEKMHKKIKSKNYLICEKSLEVFRLSLFFCDYKKLVKKSNFFFAIELDEVDFRIVLKKFLKKDSQYNNIVKYTLASNRYKTALQKLTDIIALENPLLYSFSDYLGAYSRGIGYIKKEYKVLNLTNIKEEFDPTRILYIGPGPSLSKNITFIKDAQKKFVLVCLASTLKLLSEHDIVSDIIISIDASTLISKQFDIPGKYFNNSILLVSSKIDKGILKKFNKEKVYMIQDSIEFFKGFGIFTGNSSGEIGYSLCCTLNIKELYLIGMDVALDQKTKSTHDSSYYINEKLDNSDYVFSDFGELDFDKDIIKVKGNFVDEVYTTRRYQQLIYNYNQVTRSINTDIKIYNLSNGAFLEGMEPLDVKNMEFNQFEQIKKKKLHKYIQKLFDNNSKRGFSKIDKNEIKDDKKIAQILFNIIKDSSEISTFNNKFNQIKLAYPTSFIYQILVLYFDLLNPYIDLIKNNKKFFQQKLNMIQLEQIKKILEFYKCKI